MPLPLSTALLVAAVALAVAGAGVLAVGIICGVASANELARLIAVRSMTGQSAGEYTIPARPQPRVRGDDGG